MRVLSVGCLAVMLAVPGVARAQNAAAPPQPAWGTSNSTVTPVSAWSFVGPLTDAGDGYRRCNVGTDVCRAPVYLDGGTLAWAIRIEACDSSATTEAVARLWACDPAPGSCAVFGEVHSGIPDAPGCNFFFAALPPPYLQIQNWNYSYFVDVFGSDGTSNVPVDFRVVRLLTVRQVSPAPAVAQFSDVPPSHPYFRFVEALAGAGISGGCGNGRFCPADPITRGEMAVFLSTALGLNFLD